MNFIHSFEVNSKKVKLPAADRGPSDAFVLSQRNPPDGLTFIGIYHCYYFGLDH
jgi:hypothetical protein